MLGCIGYKSLYSKDKIHSKKCVSCGCVRSDVDKAALHRCPRCGKGYLSTNYKVDSEEARLKKEINESEEIKSERSYSLIVMSFFLLVGSITGTIHLRRGDVTLENDPVFYWAVIIFFSLGVVFSVYKLIKNFFKSRELRDNLDKVTRHK